MAWAWAWKPPWPGRTLTTAASSKLGVGATSSSPPSSYASSVRLIPAPLGSSFAVPATCRPGCTTSCTAVASNLFGPGLRSPLALYAAEAPTLGWFSRSAPSSAYCSTPCSAPCSTLRSAPGSASHSSPPTTVCYEAAGASETDTAAATIGPASLSRLSSPALFYNVAGRTLGRGCSNAQCMCVDQPAFIISTSTAGQAMLQYNTLEPGLGCSSVQDTCVDHPASITSTASQAPPQYDAEDGTHGTVASNELCHTAVPATASLSQARTVTLR